jgi:nitrogen fixation/metabolism regulation signal transduction histidine kinase
MGSDSETITVDGRRSTAMDGEARPYSPADARLTAILDSLLLGAVIIDPARHRIVYVNAEAAAIINSPVADMLGKVCHQFICPVAAGQCPITDLHQDIDHSERCVLDHAGEKIPILKTVKKIQFAGRDHLLETFMDISAVKEKDRLQGVLEMAGAAAHHLGQPLQILLTSIEYLSRHPSEKQPHDMVEEMLKATRRLKAIIHRIQNITQYETEEYIKGRRIVDLEKASLR